VVGRLRIRTTGFLIFTAKYFSLVRVSQDIKRPDVQDIDNATAFQLLKVWAPFAAQTGTYELNGNILRLSILVAKNQSLEGQTRVQRIKLSGKTLLMQPYVDGNGAPLSKPVSLTLTRVEETAQ
jgi:hypothetical protein